MLNARDKKIEEICNKLAVEIAGKNTQQHKFRNIKGTYYDFEAILDTKCAAASLLIK